MTTLPILLRPSSALDLLLSRDRASLNCPRKLIRIFDNREIPTSAAGQQRREAALLNHSLHVVVSLAHTTVAQSRDLK